MNELINRIIGEISFALSNKKKLANLRDELINEKILYSPRAIKFILDKNLANYEIDVNNIHLQLTSSPLFLSYLLDFNPEVAISFIKKRVFNCFAYNTENIKKIINLDVDTINGKKKFIDTLETLPTGFSSDALFLSVLIDVYPEAAMKFMKNDAFLSGAYSKENIDKILELNIENDASKGNFLLSFDYLPYELGCNPYVLSKLLDLDIAKAIEFIKNDSIKESAFREELLDIILNSTYKKDGKDTRFFSDIEKLPFSLGNNPKVLSLLLDLEPLKALKFIKNGWFKTDAFTPENMTKLAKYDIDHVALREAAVLTVRNHGVDGIAELGEKNFFRIVSEGILERILYNFSRKLIGDGSAKLVKQLKEISDEIEVPSFSLIRNLLYIQTKEEYEQNRKKFRDVYLSPSLGEEIKEYLIEKIKIPKLERIRLNKNLKLTLVKGTIENIINENKSKTIESYIKAFGIVIPSYGGSAKDNTIYSQILKALQKVNLNNEVEIYNAIIKALNSITLSSKTSEMIKVGSKHKDISEILSYIGVEKGSRLYEILVQKLENIKETDIIDTITETIKINAIHITNTEQIKDIKEQRKETLIQNILGKCGITKTKKLAIWGNTEKESLLYDILSKTLSNFDLSNEEEITLMIEKAIISIQKDAFLKYFKSSNNKYASFLIDEICDFALNNQKTKMISEIFNTLLKNTKMNFLELTDKGKEKIIKIKKLESFNNNKVYYLEKNKDKSLLIISNFLGIPKEKAISVYDSLLRGEKTDLTEMSTHKLPELEFFLASRLVLQEEIGTITNIDKKLLPFSEMYFKIPFEKQKVRFLMSLLLTLEMQGYNIVNVDGNIGEGAKNLIENVLETIRYTKKGKKEEKLSGLEALLGLTRQLDSQNIPMLDALFKSIKSHTSEPYVIQNFENFLDISIKLSSSGTREKLLGKETYYNLSKTEMADNCEHYTSKMSRLCYRTIPRIKGKTDDVWYEMYEVGDPEQLIAGTRINSIHSCFRIGEFQDQTIRYITSSPDGIIIKFMDKDGKFIGRVYGYRVGDMVNFTRIYVQELDTTFDYKKAMESIATDLIKSSRKPSEDGTIKPAIKAVTAIPYTCVETKSYKPVYPYSKFFDSTVNPQDLYTDHKMGITLIADYDDESDKIITDFTETDVRYIIMNADPECETKKYYKERRHPQTGKTDENIDIVGRISALYGELADSIEFDNATFLVAGQEWFILIKKDGTIDSKVYYYDQSEMGFNSVVKKEYLTYKSALENIIKRKEILTDVALELEVKRIDEASAQKKEEKEETVLPKYNEESIKNSMSL